MADCKSCGAPASKADLLLCEFCGAAARDTITADEELEAVKELARTAQRLSAEDAASGPMKMMGGMSMKDMMSMDPQVMKRRQMEMRVGKVGALWQTAFIPRTFEAQIQVFQQVTTLMDTAENSNMMKAGKAAERNKALIGYAKKLLAAMKAEHGNNPDYATKIQRVEEQIASVRKESSKAGLKIFKNMGIAAVAIFGMVWIFGAVTKSSFSTAMELTEDDCRYKNHNRKERLDACSQACDKGEKWACHGLALLNAGTSNAKDLGGGSHDDKTQPARDAESKSDSLTIDKPADGESVDGLDAQDAGVVDTGVGAEAAEGAAEAGEALEGAAEAGEALEGAAEAGEAVEVLSESERLQKQMKEDAERLQKQMKEDAERLQKQMKKDMEALGIDLEGSLGEIIIE